jgi:hypothetical protein
MLPDAEIRPVPSAPEYGVTRDGRVFRLAPWARMPRALSLPFEVKQRHDSDGYLIWGRGLKAHRAVAEAFLENQDGLPEVAHRNGKRDDNRIENLRWSTTVSNHADKRAHGTMLLGEDHPGAQLTADLVREARRRAARGEPHTSIARDMPVERSVLSRAIRGDTWRHVA